MNNSIRTDSISAVLRSNLDKSQNNLSKTLQRMSSGLKVLSAKDDASGAVISSKTKIELSGLNIANNNIQSGISMFNVAEGALKEAENILIKLRDLSLQAANEILGKDERKAIQAEADELVAELEKIQLGTTYNHLNLFNNQPDDNKNNTVSDGGNEPQVGNAGGGESPEPSPSPQNSPLNSPQNSPLNSPQMSPLNLSRTLSPLNLDNTGGNSESDNILIDEPDSISDSNSAGGVRLMSAGLRGAKGVEDTGRIAENEENDGVYITGAFDFEANETYKINIDGVTYEVTNRNATNSTISYSKEIETGKVTFNSNYFTITGISDTDYDIIINGTYNYVYGGNNKNTFTPYDLKWSKNNYFYGGSGDDVFDIVGYGNKYYGQGGNDTFNINSGASTYNYCYGGEGDDVFNHNKNGQDNYYGEAGNDTFNINGNTAICYGGNNNDTFNLVKGNNAQLYGQNGDDSYTVAEGCANTTIDGGAGTNSMVNNGTNTTSINVIGANSYTVHFAKNEQKDIVINVGGQDITYTIKNRSSAQDLAIKVNEDNRIDFLTSSFTITGQKDVAHYVGLMKSSIYFYGGDLNDNVYLGSNSQIVDTGKGNDIVTNASSYNSIFTGDGDDKIYASNYGDMQTGDGDDEVIYKGGYYYNYIDLGNGNDTIRGENTNGTVNNNRAYTSSAIFGGSGTDSFQLAGSSANTSTNYIKDGFDTSKFSTFEIGASETKNLVIHTNSGDMTYNIKNRINHDKTIHYYYDSVEDKIIFAGGNIDIRGELDKKHNVDLYSSTYIYFYGGNLDDNINMVSGYNNYIYGGKGNDTLNSSETAPYARLYGEDGEDTIYINSSQGYAYGGNNNDTIYVNANNCQICDGEQGDDSYYIRNTVSSIDNYGNNVYYIDTNGITLSAGAGDDTFYITGDSNSVAGGGGDDYFIVSGTGNNLDGGTGTNYIVDNGEGNVKPNTDVDPNAGALVFTYINEQHSFSIDDKLYIVKNCTETADNVANNNVSYTYNKNTGEIIFTGSNLTITACDGISHNIRIEGNNNTVNGGNYSDTIIVNSGTNNLIKGNSGDDIITLSSANNGVQGGSGNDTVNINASTNKTVDLGIGNDIVYINSNNNTDINTGAGNDTVRSTTGTSGNTIDLNSGNNDILLTGNNNTINASNGSNRISVVGNSNNVSSGSGSNIIGANGNNNTLEARGNSVFNAQGDNNSFSLSGNKNIVNSRGVSGEVTSIGNNTINLTGNESSVNSIGNSTINVKGNGSSVTSIGNSDITTEGLNVVVNSIGNSTINQNGNDANIVADTGNVTLLGSNATLSAKGVNLNIYGDNNNITNASENTGSVNVEIEGSNNTINSSNLNDNVKLTGDNNTLALNNLNDKVEMKGNNNTLTETGGNNTVRLRGDNNNIQGGLGIDSLRINSGLNNVFDGGETEQKNTIYNLGENTIFNNCTDITPRPLHVSIQVGAQAQEALTETIQFMLGDFWIDVSTRETSIESMEKIDEAINGILEQQSLIGSSVTRLEQILQLNQNKIENLNIKKSLITDCDIAEEAFNFTSNNIRKDMQVSLFSQTISLKQANIMKLISGAVA